MPTDIIVVNKQGPPGPRGPIGPEIDGLPGADGADGVSVLAYPNTVVTRSVNSYASLHSYNMLSDTLKTIGSGIVTSCAFDVDIVTGIKNVILKLGGTTCHTKVPVFSMIEGAKYMNVEAHIFCQTTTTVFIKFRVSIYNEEYFLLNEIGFFETGFTVLDLTANACLIDFQGEASGAGDVLSANEFIVTYYKK